MTGLDIQECPRCGVRTQTLKSRCACGAFYQPVQVIIRCRTKRDTGEPHFTVSVEDSIGEIRIPEEFENLDLAFGYAKEEAVRRGVDRFYVMGTDSEGKLTFWKVML